MVNTKKVNVNHYLVSGLNLKENPAYQGPWDTCQVEHSQDLHVYFENGRGDNGLTVGTLLGIVVDRMEQTNPNSNALVHVRAALAGLVS